MEVCYTNLGNLRAADVNINGKVLVKYLWTYESRERELPILLYHIDTKDGISYYEEYYTGNIIIALDSPEKTYKELNPNIVDKTINDIPYLAIDIKDIKQIDAEFTNRFYLNEQTNKINDIMAAIDHLVDRTKTNVSNYLTKAERIMSFKCYENAYLDNAIYDLKNGISYKMKKKTIDNK